MTISARALLFSKIYFLTNGFCCIFLLFLFTALCKAFKNRLQARHWWLMPEILTTWKAEIRRIVVRGQPG
jgi:hypothetical protein